VDSTPRGRGSLDGLRVVDAVAEVLVDRVDVEPAPVRCDLRHDREPCPRVGHDGVRALRRALAHVPGDDELRRPADGRPRPALAHDRRVVALRVDVDLALGGPTVLHVHIDQGRGEVTHEAVMEALAPHADRKAEAADGVAVGAGHARSRAGTVAVHQRREHFQTLLVRQHVGHGEPCLAPGAVRGHPPRWRTSGAPSAPGL
jgi:hypothetical protein